MGWYPCIRSRSPDGCSNYVWSCCILLYNSAVFDVPIVNNNYSYCTVGWSPVSFCKYILLFLLYNVFVCSFTGFFLISLPTDCKKLKKRRTSEFLYPRYGREWEKVTWVFLNICGSEFPIVYVQGFQVALGKVFLDGSDIS